MSRLLLVVALAGILLSLGAKPAVKSVVVEAVQDAFVVTDASTAEDPQKVRDQSFGNADSVRVSYAFKVKGDEQLVSIGLFAFGLEPLQGLEVESATLQLFALRTDLAQPSRLIDLSLVRGPWTEKEVTFNARPPWDANPIATTAVYGPERWYSWDVTQTVGRLEKRGTVSYALGLRTVEEKKEEQVLFVSHEGGRSAPRLVVTYTPRPSGIGWYPWAGGIAGAAVIAFVVGWWLARRRRSVTSA